MKLLSTEGLAPAAIKQCLEGVFGEASTSYSTVKEWAEQLHFGRGGGEDEPHEVPLMAVVTEEIIRFIKAELLNVRRVTLKVISVRVEVPKPAVICNIHENLHTIIQGKMGAQTSFLNSGGALFDVLSEAFRALPLH
jgi:hypothetical protein